MEAFAVKDKIAQTVANLLVNDNGPENVNEVITHDTKSLNMYHITTSPYHLQGNVILERFHTFLGDMLDKLSEGENKNWDLVLTLVAVVSFPLTIYADKILYCL